MVTQLFNGHKYSRFAWQGAAVAIIGAGTAFAAPDVSMTGGSDASGFNYSWTILHQHVSPLIYVEIPHYRADLFDAPNGWTTEITNRNGTNFKAGKCIASAEDFSKGIVAGHSAQFGLSITSIGAPRGIGHVVLGFADGAEVSVTAEVPTKPSRLEQWAMPLSLVAVFGVFLAVRAVRTRRSSSK